MAAAMMLPAAAAGIVLAGAAAHAQTAPAVPVPATPVPAKPVPAAQPPATGETDEISVNGEKILKADARGLDQQGEILVVAHRIKG